MIALGLLPYFGLLLLFFVQPVGGTSAGERVLTASLCFGVLSVAIAEVTSLFHAYGFWPLLIAWVSIISILGVFIARESRVATPLRPPPVKIPGFVVAAVIGSLATLVIGLISAPNNFDSMTYHMPRVMNWIQNGSVGHYPTDVGRQITYPPFAELAIGQLVLLSGSDVYANSVQWLAMAGSVVAVWLISERMGADHLESLFAAVFTATIPMGILQSATTQTDYVVTLWLAAATYFLVLETKSPKLKNRLMIGTALGLAVLTKPTAYIFGAPVALWIAVSFGWRHRRRVPWAYAAVLIPFLLINSGHYARNIHWVGSPLGDEMDVGASRNARFGADIVMSNLVRNAAVHLGSTRALNTRVERAVDGVHSWLGMGATDPDATASYAVDEPFRIPRPNTSEDRAGSPLHLIIAVSSFMAVFLSRRLRSNHWLVGYALAVLLACLVFAAYVSWDPWRQRFHLTVLVLLSPVAGYVLGHTTGRAGIRAAGWILVAGSLPWIVSMENRPLIPIRPFSYEPSILVTARMTQYFFAQSELEEPYRKAIGSLNLESCSQLGLVSSFDEWEYPVWVLLRQRKQDFVLTHSDPLVRAPGGEDEDVDTCVRIYLGLGIARMAESSSDHTLFESDPITVVAEGDISR